MKRPREGLLVVPVCRGYLVGGSSHNRDLKWGPQLLFWPWNDILWSQVICEIYKYSSEQ